ncbi:MULTISPECIES: tol-pal system-associated acyl-CoA thioesterase [Brachymonas]|uniref:tol-pal system-associated acyl-CoA thioesterase n=1 Tax=Brachymonas TaxID=28219 RepID=UPI002E77B96C|nr:tol-pal system-associated acyl-CoA thioesterase [Brachymonas sp. J145]MEE1652743.1 tol-pal system-associated acyl-CoA thioesterase [Brachymonas sp. J145]
MMFHFAIRVYWEDTDAGGIVFYANYLKFFERARTEWLRAKGIEQQALREQTGGMFVVTGTEMKYHRPARLDDVLCVSATPLQLGRASVVIGQSARLGAPDGPLLCEGTIRIGWVNAERMQSARMPADLLQALEDGTA